MASFTDQLVAFNPYVSQLPVDDYVRVGMIKQQEYNQGVEKVQGYIDSVAGLEVIKPEQKDYLHQRINNLQQETGRIVQADFSNQQLVNSVGALTSKIASDPIIQTSVASTQSYKQGLASMQESREKGKSSVSNEWDFQDQFSKWYNDKDVTSRFSGSFTPYTDVNKKVLDAIKGIAPNIHIEDIPYRRDLKGNIEMGADGRPVIDMAMMTKSLKGVSPDKIEAAINANLTADDVNQLMIDGRYSYRGRDAAGMKDVTDRRYQFNLDRTNDIIQGLMIKRATANNDPDLAASIDAQIEAYKGKASDLQSSYARDMAGINNNLEGYKGSFYAKDYVKNFGDSYAYAEESITYKENPYFMAAERRRENDIKFKEFVSKQQIDYLNYGLNVERLGLERDKLEAYKNSLSLKAAGKKTAQGALDGIPLSDAILEPIQQDELQKINLDSFLKETDQIGADIDQQKMALLGNTGLVTIKRDPDGTNPRYEYNVAGKDANTVIGAANAAIGQLKDAYDKDPNSVDDGTRTYFRNLANADQVVQNRKFSINKIQSDAEKEHNLTPYLSQFKDIKMTTGGGQTLTVTPTEMMEFNKKLDQVYPVNMPSSGGGYGPIQNTHLDDDKAAKIMTPKEKVLYGLFKKDYEGRATTDFEKGVIGTVNAIQSKVNNKAGKIIAARDKYVDNAVRSVVGTQEPVSFTLEAFEAADRNRAKAVASRLVNTIITDDKSNPNPRYDEGDIKKMLGKESGNTSYSLVSKGRGRYALALSNTEVTGNPVEMDLTRAQAEELFGQNKFLDDFYNIRQSLDLSKSSGKWTTDVRGLGREGAFNLENGLTNKYSVKYHVEEPLKNGGLQVRMYIYDKAAGQWLPEKTAGFGQLLNEAQVTKFLSTVGDQYIDATLLPKK